MWTQVSSVQPRYSFYSIRLLFMVGDGAQVRLRGWWCFVVEEEEKEDSIYLSSHMLLRL